MVDVTRENFKDLLPKIIEEIKKCEFLSIDTEFTGLDKNYNNLFDTHQERYKNICREEKYSIIQFGLSIFEKENELKKINCNCYNFYIFKHDAHNLFSKVKNYEIQPSAIHFLALNYFDFNQLFQKGIDFISLEEETEIINCLGSYENFISNDLISPSKQILFRDAMNSFSSFISKPCYESHCAGPFDFFTANLILEFFKEKKSKLLEGGNIPVIFNFKELKKVDDNLYEIHIFKEKVLKQDEKPNLKKIIEEISGFTMIIKTIFESNKPLVGHNIFLDLIHIIHQFVSPLPNNYEEFKFMLRELLPNVFDTKHISIFLENLYKNKAKSLSELYEYFKNNYPSLINKTNLVNANFLEEKIDQDSSNLTQTQKDNQTKAQFHQAGYDSFITGVCFLVMKNLSENSYGVSIYNDERFKDKFFNAFSIDIPYFSSRTDVNLDRNNVYYLKFDYDPQPFDKILKQFKYKTFSQLDDNSCLLQIKKNPENTHLLERLSSLKNLNIISYKAYLSIKNKK